MSQIFRYCSLAGEVFACEPADPVCERCEGDCEVLPGEVTKIANEAQSWKDRYFRLRDLIKEVAVSAAISKADLVLNVAGAKQIKDRTRALLTQSLMKDLLTSGTVIFRDRDFGPDSLAVEIVASAFVVPDGRALASLVREAGERKEAPDEHAV